jgi:hypothetical protein
VRPQRLGDLGGELAGVAALDRDPHLTRVEAACPEDVVDDPREAVRLARDDLEQAVALRLLEPHVVALQRQRGAVDRRERRAQLV